MNTDEHLGWHVAGIYKAQEGKQKPRPHHPAMVPLEARVPVSQDAKDIVRFMILEVDLTVLKRV